MDKKTYDIPEMVELGLVAELTLGDPNLEAEDNCECKKDPE